MFIAKIQNGTVADIADYRNLFPEVSFPSTGPDADFLTANDCMVVTTWKNHNAETEKLVSTDAYIEDNFVYTVQVEPLTEEELAQRAESNKAKVKAQAEKLLAQTDWVEVPSVSDTTKIPHLANYDEFMTYRLALRAIAVTPSATITEWPTLPTENWVTE